VNYQHSTTSFSSDEEIVRSILEKKDTARFALLYDRYADKVYAKCLSFTRDQQQAEDLTHDILLKVYVKLAEFEFKSKFSTWLYSITYRFCVDYIRKNNTQLENYQQYAAQYEEEDKDDAQLMEIQAARLKQLLEYISPEDRSLLLMKYQDDLPVTEIAAITELSESAVKMRLKRARDKLITMAKDDQR
jgi:RNA polymerase sigma factor (sigma-70 family)